VIGYSFEPHSDTDAFCREILSSLGVPDELLHVCSVIVEAASHTPALEDVPLMLPNDDLFPLYALVGRAILMADRESAASKVLETWRA